MKTSNVFALAPLDLPASCVPMSLCTIELVTRTDAAVAAVIAGRAAQGFGASKLTQARLATCAAELASNAVMHGGGGVLHVKGTLTTTATRSATTSTVFIIEACDRGAGSAAVVRDRLERGGAVVDGGSLGAGLAGVVRLMDGLLILDRDGGGLTVRAWATE